jgi:hypothetical protein
MSRKKNGNGNGNGHLIIDEKLVEPLNDGSYPKHDRMEVNRRKLFEGREGDSPKIFSIPKNWLISLGLLFFYTGFITVTTTCILSKVLYLV